MSTGLKIWFSHTEDFENFEEGVKDADSFSLSIPTTNTLMWVKGVGSLLVGTSGEEWQIYSSKQDSVITPTNFTIDLQSNFGSNSIQPVIANTAVLFVNSVGRKLHELVWNDVQQKFLAPDLTVLAEHITATGITNIALQKNPDMMLWCALADGSFISFTYNREQNVLAWADHPIAQATVQSVCVTPNSALGEDEVWISIGRTINSLAVIYIEKLNSRYLPAAIADCFFVDSGLTFTEAEGIGYSIDSYTKLLSSFDGADTATTYTDPAAGAATFVGTAQLDTAQKVFGTASLLLDGDSDYITYPDSADWSFGTGDFTIDGRVIFNALVKANEWFCMAGQYVDVNNFWLFGIYESAGYYYLGIAQRIAGVLSAVNSSAITIAINTKYHIACVANSGTITLYFDGISKGAGATLSFPNIVSVLYVGVARVETNHYHDGWIDQLRISKGIARWTADFDIVSSASPASYRINGLEHLEGETVAIFVDGEIKVSAVVSNGSLTFTSSDTPETIQVGLPYTYELEPMRFDISTPRGTALGSIKKVPEIIVSLLDSANVKYGDSSGNLYDIDITSAGLINKSSITGLYTGDVSLHFDGGFSVDDSLIISGSDPLPCTVRCLIPKVDITGR